MRRVEPQLDCRYRAWCKDHALDLRGEECTLDKTPAQRGVRLAEQPPALDPDHTVAGAQDLDADSRAYLIGDGFVIHHVDSQPGAGHALPRQPRALGPLEG